MSLDTMEGVFRRKVEGRRGPQEPLTVAAPDFTVPVRSGPSQALFGLSSDFLLPLLSCVSCPSQYRVLQQLSRLTLLHTAECLHKESSLAYCLTLLSHNSDL